MERKANGMTVAEAVNALVVIVLIAAVLVPVITDTGMPSKSTMSTSNIRQLGLAVLMSAADNDDHTPPASEWMDAVMPYVKNMGLYVDPMLEKLKKDEFGFAFYRPMAYLGYENISNPEEVPILFTSTDLRWNATGDLSLLARRVRGGWGIAAFMDGHAKAMPPTWPEKPIEIKFGP